MVAEQKQVSCCKRTEETLDEHIYCDMLSWEKIDEDTRNNEIWETQPAYPSPQMVHAAHQVTTEVPLSYDGSTSWLKYSDSVEKWGDLEPRRRGPAHLSGRAEFFKEKFDRDRLKDPEIGVEYFLATMRPFFAKNDQAVFLSRFFQMLRCNRGPTDDQRWLIKYEIARGKAIETWLKSTTT